MPPELRAAALQVQRGGGASGPDGAEALPVGQASSKIRRLIEVRVAYSRPLIDAHPLDCQSALPNSALLRDCFEFETAFTWGCNGL